jgi:AraC family transcriptional regulator
LGKIAVELEQELTRRRTDGTAGQTRPRVLASGVGWSVADVVCTCGPQDRPYEERHAYVAIAVVLAGSFQYRSSAGRGLMTAGSLLLGNDGDCFECAHQHGEGDRCVAFWYEPDYFERLSTDAGLRGSQARFTIPRVPPLRELSAFVTGASAGVEGAVNAPWEELAVTIGVRAARLAAGASSCTSGSALNAEARVTRVIRAIDHHSGGRLSLGRLAREAGLSPYHFLRTFTSLVGVTPHQYVLRTRLREAAARLIIEPDNVLDVALDSGFGDVSNFNRAFRQEFGVSPRAYRRNHAALSAPLRSLRD